MNYKQCRKPDRIKNREHLVIDLHMEKINNMKVNETKEFESNLNQFVPRKSRLG